MKARMNRVVVVLTAALLMFPIVARAQDAADTRNGSADVQSAGEQSGPVDISLALAVHTSHQMMGPWRAEHRSSVTFDTKVGSQSQPQIASPPKRHRLGWAVVGGAVGFVTGAIAGYEIDRHSGPCNCDSPGHTGLMVGAVIGAAGGATLLAFFHP